ncbi:MAG: hypothetical protein GY898_30405 [Proteobacteria bacterium]|nr:hypothetical protein [Pseudomonadota bacterium]
MLKARDALARGKKRKADKLLAKTIAAGTAKRMKLDVALAKLVRGDEVAYAELEALGCSWFVSWGRARSS